jgi:hypothetical protein
MANVRPLRPTQTVRPPIRAELASAIAEAAEATRKSGINVWADGVVTIIGAPGARSADAFDIGNCVFNNIASNGLNVYSDDRCFVRANDQQ